MEQDGIDQREDGRVCADAERQREQHGDGKARRLAQLAKCVGKILEQNPHSPPNTPPRASFISTQETIGSTQ
jgi:hypothetical protein